MKALNLPINPLVTDAMNKLAREIGKGLPLDWSVVSAAVYLHDHFSSDKYDRQEFAKLLSDAGLDQDQVTEACRVLGDRSLHISRYLKDPKAWEHSAKLVSWEQKVVSDALHLKLIGALGIGRLFAFSGVIGRRFLLPPDRRARGEEDTLDRFSHRLQIEKVMLTPRGKKLAKDRILFTKTFLERFQKEWEGKA